MIDPPRELLHTKDLLPERVTIKLIYVFAIADAKEPETRS